VTWTNSNLSGAGVSALIGGTFYGTGQTFGTGSGGDTINCALYNTTPVTATARDDTFAHNAYLAAGGQWVTANEITGSGYSAGGNTLGTKTNAESSGLVSVGAANTSWTTATLAGIFGDLVYDNTVTNKYAYCWNYFGGTQSVTAGTFTIAWNSGNIFTVTIT
jgi:hypothetical protein